MKVPPFTLESQLAVLGPELDAAVLKVLHSGHYIGGEEVQKFEKSFAESIGVAYAVSCNSGTDALVLALRALDIGKGDEVITSSFSFFATAEAISAVGATPVFVDVEPSNYLIDLNRVKEAITPATKAILPVHLFGCPVDMESLMDLAKKKGLKVIEDCAQASGALWQGRPVGGWGDIGCFSFFPTKNLGAAGDGGAVSTNDSELAKRMRELAVHGMPRRYVHHELGYNSRLDAIQAAILNVKLPKLSDWINQRQTIAERYQKMLTDLPGVEIPLNPNNNISCHAWNQFVIRVKSTPYTRNLLFSDETSSLDEGNSSNQSSDISCRDWLKSKLLDQGINTIIYYPIPIHLQTAYQALGHEFSSLPITEKLCSEVLSLPIFPEITTEQQNYVVRIIRQLLNPKRESNSSVSC